MEYRNKILLAPMVRIGTLPMRLTALHFGADLVFTPEIVDKGIIDTERIVNEKDGTIDYVNSLGKTIFRTCAFEKDRLIYQIGSSDPELADVSGIDLNCGCPKWFSVHNGMGAGLLKNPKKLEAILKALVEKTGKPVSCKIRITESVDETLELVKIIKATGVKALTVHCRTVKERPIDPAHWERLKAIVECAGDDLPVIANGDIFDLSDAQKWKDLSGCSSCMIARAAQRNPSVFRKDGVIPVLQSAKIYLENALRHNILFGNGKYTLLQMFPTSKEAIGKALLETKTMAEACHILGLEHSNNDNILHQESLLEECPYIPREEYIPEKKLRKIMPKE